MEAPRRRTPPVVATYRWHASAGVCPDSNGTFGQTRRCTQWSGHRGAGSARGAGRGPLQPRGGARNGGWAAAAAARRQSSASAAGRAAWCPCPHPGSCLVAHASCHQRHGVECRSRSSIAVEREGGQSRMQAPETQDACHRLTRTCVTHLDRWHAVQRHTCASVAPEAPVIHLGRARRAQDTTQHLGGAEGAGLSEASSSPAPSSSL